MRALIIISLFYASALTGCKLFHAVHSETPPITGADLAVKHVYKVPQHKRPQPLSRFNDPQLHQLILVAFADAPSMGSAKARLAEAQQIARGTYSKLWPSAGLSGYLQKNHFSFQGVIPPPFNELIFTKADIADIANIADIALNFNYELDFWGKNRENVASKLDEAYAAQMDLEETRLILSSSVATTYFELQNTLIQHRLAKENARLQKELANIVTDRAKQGIESDVPVKTAISNAQSALLSIEDFKRAEMQARHQLAVLLGKNPFNTQIDTGRFAYSKKQVSVPAIIPAHILAQRPDIAAARALAESAAHQVKVARTAFFPDINLSGLVSTQSFYFSKLFHLSFETEGVKGALSLPIFDAGARRANLGARNAEYELAVNQYNQSILNALQQVSDQITSLHTLNKQITEQVSALSTTESNYKLFRSQYAHGIIDYVQLIEIKQVMLQQQAMLYTLQTRQKQAFVALLTALGGEVSL